MEFGQGYLSSKRWSRHLNQDLPNSKAYIHYHCSLLTLIYFCSIGNVVWYGPRVFFKVLSKDCLRESSNNIPQCGVSYMQWLIDNLYIFWTEVYVTNFGKKWKLLLTELMLLLLLLVTKSCPTCNHMDCSPLGSSVLRQQYWSGLPFPSPGDLPDPGIKPASSALASGFFTTKPPGKPVLTC